MQYSSAVFSAHILDRIMNSQDQTTINIVSTFVQFGHVWYKISCTSSLILVMPLWYWQFLEKDCFPDKSTSIPISDVNNFKTIWSRTIKFVHSKGNQLLNQSIINFINQSIKLMLFKRTHKIPGNTAHTCIIKMVPRTRMSGNRQHLCYASICCVKHNRFLQKLSTSSPRMRGVHGRVEPLKI